MPRKKNDSCRTPPWLYKALDAEFAFDLDPCPLAEKPAFDGLKLDWTGRRVFCNPPYSAILPWVEKALASPCLTVFLVPKRFNALWARKLCDARADIRLMARGITFASLSGKKSHPLGGSMVVVLNRLHRL